MVMEIPGFYYDEDKKKYFKIEQNGSNHQYNSTLLKHKREEEEIKLKISKLKLNRLQPLDLIQSKVLNIKNSYSYVSPEETIKEQSRYIYSCLEIRKKNENLVDLFPDSTLTTKINGIQLNNYHGVDLEILAVQQGSHTFYYSRKRDDDELQFLADHCHPISSLNYKLTSSTMTDENVLYYILVNLTTGKSLLSGAQLDLETLNYTFSPQEDKDIPEFVNGCRKHGNDLITFGNRTISYFEPDRCDYFNELNSIDTNDNDALCLDISVDQISYIGFRNGKIKLWDVRDDEFNHCKTNSKSSVINIEMINDIDIVVSRIGSDVELFDKRMGFEIPKIKYNSIKKVQDIFDETLQFIDTERFLISNKNSTEIFDINNSNSLKTISTFNNPISEAYFSNSFINDKFPLYLFTGQNYDSYGI